ncbi:hypothetical protein ADUPG1_007335, partial [Aduncisulcus paluster]
TTFMQHRRSFVFFNRMPLGWWYICTTKNEEVYYMLAHDDIDDCIIVTGDFDECPCVPTCYDDASRLDDGTVYCISQV